jgi:hypothetical protein
MPARNGREISRPPAASGAKDDVVAYLYQASDVAVARRVELAAEVAASPMFSALVEGKLPKDSFLPVGQFPAGAGRRPVLVNGEAVKVLLGRKGGPAASDLRHALAVIAAPSTVGASTPKGAVLFGRSAGKLWRVALRGDAKGRLWLVGFQQKNEASARRNLQARGVALQ